MSNLLPTAKAGVQIVAGIGVSKIVADIVTNNVPAVTTAQKVVVRTGSFVLGSMLWEQSTHHIERQTEELVQLYRKWQDKNTDTEVTT